MSFSLGLTVKGVKGAQNALKQFQQDIPQDVADFLEQIGQQVNEEQTSLCPVDTGNLQSSIGYSVDGTDLNFEATAEYAGFVEYGTSKMAAQPFFMPPIDNLAGSGIGEDFGRDALARWESLVNEYKDQ